MGVLGNNYLLTVRGHALTSGTLIENAFVYQQTSPLGSSGDLMDAFAGAILPYMLDLSNAEYVVDDLLTINLQDPSDYGNRAVNDAGTVTGEYLPIYNCWQFEYLRTTRAIQNGRKAIGIISESMQANGAPTPTALTALTAMGGAMGSLITIGSPGGTYEPRLWRRPGSYSSGVVVAPGLFYPVANVQFRRISTQGTRKIGRGS